MDAAQREYLKQLIAEPRESLDVELKPWIDPTSEVGKGKIAKACLALRNNNGGILLVGFANDGSVDPSGPPSTLETSWHFDRIQEIVAKFASEPFSIDVEFVERDGIRHPAIVVPSGIRTPLACRSDLPSDGRLLKCHAVYVRTLNSNNTVSSSEATYKDWPRLAEFCFDNREANVGAFVRRHLSGVNLREAIAALTSLEVPNLGQPEESSLLRLGRAQFEKQWSERSKEPFPPLGTFEFAVVADGRGGNLPLARETLWTIEGNIPRISGWPPWVGVSGASDSSMHPYVLDGGWEAFISGNILGPHLDFWRIEPAGKLYHLRLLEDDVKSSPDSPEPRTVLDYYLQIVRVAQFLAVAIRIVKSLAFDNDETQLGVAVRWTHLKNRELIRSDRRPFFQIRTADICRQDEITTATQLSLATPDSALGPHVQALVSPVFALFGGFAVNEPDYQRMIDEFFGRRYG